MAVVAAAGLWPSSSFALSPGSLDPSFGSGGTVLHQFGLSGTPYSEAQAVAVQPDGKLVVGGHATAADGHNELFVARLGADGSLDSSFGSGGALMTQLGKGTSPDSGVTIVSG